MPQARIGDNCQLGQNVFVGNRVTLGKGCKVQNNVSLYEGVICGDKVFIGPSVVFTNVLNPRAFIERKTEFLPTTIHQGATIGANATIVCGVALGEYCLVAAGAVVTHSVEPYTIVGGTPARFMGYISEAGEKLLFNEEGFAHCPTTNMLYRLDNGKVHPIF